MSFSSSSPQAPDVGCGNVNDALARLSEARGLAADLRVEFTKASDAADRAVMADTDTASVSDAHEAEQSTAAVKKDVETLRPLLQGLGYSDEIGLLDVFVSRFADYEALDRRILDLAVENTNLKAQQLSFGSARETADAFRDALDAIAPGSEKDTWRVKALASAAVEAVREIQVLQAPHIAEADDAAMTAMEKRMAESEAVARRNIASLGPIVQPGSRPHLAAATADLDTFMALNAQIVGLSRQNTNVRSLALSLNQKGPLAAACEESLGALTDALAKRGFTDRR